MIMYSNETCSVSKQQLANRLFDKYLIKDKTYLKTDTTQNEIKYDIFRIILQIANNSNTKYQNRTWFITVHI